MYFDLPFCVKSVKRVKRVKENVGNPLLTIGYAFKEVKLQLIFRAIILPPYMHFWSNLLFYAEGKIKLIKIICIFTSIKKKERKREKREKERKS